MYVFACVFAEGYALLCVCCVYRDIITHPMDELPFLISHKAVLKKTKIKQRQCVLPQLFLGLGLIRTPHNGNVYFGVDGLWGEWGEWGEYGECGEM